MAAGLELRATYPVELVKFEDLRRSLPLNSLVVLSIDTEGNELEILQSIDFSTFTPSIIVLEELVSPISSNSKSRDLLSQSGYVLHAYTGSTSIYRNLHFQSF
jgi:hypothetical protein